MQRSHVFNGKDDFFFNIMNQAGFRKACACVAFVFDPYYRQRDIYQKFDAPIYPTVTQILPRNTQWGSVHHNGVV